VVNWLILIPSSKQNHEDRFMDKINRKKEKVKNHPKTKLPSSDNAYPKAEQLLRQKPIHTIFATN
jgi:hypothetical protein